MNAKKRSNKVAALLAVVGLSLPLSAYPHCDTMDGPVVAAARLALELRDVTPVLKWVRQANEAEVRQAFTQTEVVRAQGPEARDLADKYFFETVVRIHRAGEGEPFTGLKPAGTEVGPAVARADEALKTESVDRVLKLIDDEAAAGIRRRFALVREKQKHSADSVEAGREYVAAYVDYVHFIEGLHESAKAQPEDGFGEHEHSGKHHDQNREIK